MLLAPVLVCWRRVPPTHRSAHLQTSGLPDLSAHFQPKSLPIPDIVRPWSRTVRILPERTRWRSSLGRSHPGCQCIMTLAPQIPVEQHIGGSKNPAGLPCCQSNNSFVRFIKSSRCQQLTLDRCGLPLIIPHPKIDSPFTPGRRQPPLQQMNGLCKPPPLARCDLRPIAIQPHASARSGWHSRQPLKKKFPLPLIYIASYNYCSIQYI